jgi:hypothetical protein
MKRSRLTKNPIMPKIPALAACLAVLLVAFFSIRTATPPKAISAEAADTVFSATRAMIHLNEIAKAPHSIGTAEETAVRQHILSACRELGLETEVQEGTGVYSFGGYIVSGKVHNILARMHGTASTKTLLIMGHYDSQPNTPGAGDDGSAVAGMLETARALKACAPLRNDLLFLFTDGEEAGLLGSAAFVADKEQREKIGLVMNFDNRGNSGISTTFEVNPDNGWVMNAYFHAADFPSANSFSYEVYKQLSNYTDYTPFKKEGITGLNSAFIEGYVNYHSMTDVPTRMDSGSIQQLGANMLSLAKYFGTTNLTKTKGNDVTYFNLAGPLVIHYPATMNMGLVILTTILFILYVIRGLGKRRISWKGFLSATGVFLLALILLILAAIALPKIYLAVYPLSGRFYDNNSYNSASYFFLLTAICTAIFCWLYKMAAKKISAESLFAGSWLLIILVMNLVYAAAPTAVYLFLFPMIFIFTVQHALLNHSAGKPGGVREIAHLFSMLPAVLLFAPTVYFSFIAFGLDRMFIPVLLFSFLLGMLLPVLVPVLVSYGKWIITLLICSAVIAAVVGHVTSSFTPEHPLQTNLWYRYDADSAKAIRISDFSSLDSWNKQFFGSAHLQMIPESNDGERLRLVNPAPVTKLEPPQLRILIDTVSDGKRKLVLNLFSQRDAISMQVFISRSAALQHVWINGVPVTTERFYSDTSAYYSLNYAGLDKEGITISLETKLQSPFSLTLIDRSLGLMEETGYTKYPTQMVPGPGSNSNTVQVVKHFRF